MKESFGIDDLEKIVQDIFIPKLKNYTIFAFLGSLGVGKTTLIRALLRSCGVTEIIASPTFTYVNTYITKNGWIFNHFDLYRVPSLESFLNCGFDEYLYKGRDYNFIEWPTVINELLSSEVLKGRVYKVQLSYFTDDVNKRVLEEVAD